jgi:hypothetical protein
MGLPSRRILCISSVSLIAVVVGAWLLVPRSRINLENFKQIKEGMSQGEVEALFGGPPGDYANWPHPKRINQFVALVLQGNDDDMVHRFWLGEEGVVKVVFDSHARVISAEFFPSDDLGEARFESPSKRFMNWLYEKITRR